MNENHPAQASLTFATATHSDSPPHAHAPLAVTREHAEIFRGQSTHACNWKLAQERLIAWLEDLPKPIGIIAFTDARARHILRACMTAGIAMPEELAVVGGDNDPISHILSRIPLSSVIQGTRRIGEIAARLLPRKGALHPAGAILVAPAGIHVAASIQHQALRNTYVGRARH